MDWRGICSQGFGLALSSLYKLQVGGYETIRVDTFYVLRRFCQPVWFHIHLPELTSAAVGALKFNFSPSYYEYMTDQTISRPTNGHGQVC